MPFLERLHSSTRGIAYYIADATWYMVTRTALPDEYLILIIYGNTQHVLDRTYGARDLEDCLEDLGMAHAEWSFV